MSARSGGNPRRVEQLRPLTIEEIEQLPDLTWLIEGYLPEGGLTVIYGPPEVGKSFTSLDWALSVASGRDWLGHHTAPPRDVVYIYAEGQNGLKQRLRAWRAAHGNPDLSRFRAVPCPVNMLDGQDRSFLVTAIRNASLQPGLIAIDTKARCFGSGDENQTKDMNTFVMGCDDFRLEHFPGTTMLVVDHTGKVTEKGARGSNALRGAADTEFFAAPVKGDADAFVLKNTKQKDRAKLPDLALCRVVIGPSCVLVRGEAMTEGKDEARPGKVENIDIAYEVLRLCGSGGATFGRWFAQCGMPKSTFNRVRRKLVDSGRVYVRGDGDDSVYFCTKRTVGDLGEDLSEPMRPTFH
jgi:predicted transcriptional regulator